MTDQTERLKADLTQYAKMIMMMYRALRGEGVPRLLCYVLVALVATQSNRQAQATVIDPMQLVSKWREAG